MRTKLSHYLMRKRTYHSDGATVRFDNARKIGIIIGIDIRQENDDFRQFINHLKDQGKQVNVLAYIPNVSHRILTQINNYKQLTDEDMNWLGMPKPEPVAHFLQKKFDMVICLNQNENFPVFYLAAVAKANLKLGLYTQEYASLFDMMIQADNDDKLKAVLDTIKSNIPHIIKN